MEPAAPAYKRGRLPGRARPPSMGRMSSTRTLTLYLEEPMRANAEAGRVNVVNRIRHAFASIGYQTLIKGDSDLEILLSEQDPGYALFHMQEPFHDRALCLRKVCFYPFWQIERTAKRWKTRAATARFDPDSIEDGAAHAFANGWRRRLFGLTRLPERGEHVFVPLQGRLLTRRSFQEMSPMQMLETTLDALPDKPIKATLHPSERYSRPEMEALDALQRRHPHLELLPSGSEDLLRECDFVISENSSLCVSGFLLGKPAVLFARAEFHHIAANISRLGVKEAIRQARHGPPPPFERYIYWYLQLSSINAGREDAEARILQAARAGGWQLQG